MAAVLILCSLGLMGWSVLGLINPLRFAQGSRARAFGVGVIGFALLMVGGAMLPPTPEPTSTATSSPTPTSAPAVSGEIVHPESDFPDEVAAFLSQGVARAHVQSDDLLQARAYNNDLVLTFDSDFSADVPDTSDQRWPSRTRSRCSCDHQAPSSPAGSGRYLVRSPRGVGRHAREKRTAASPDGPATRARAGLA